MPERDATQKHDFLALAHERFRFAEEAETRWRRDALEDVEFYVGNQWPNDIKTARNNEGRPCLEFNKMPQRKRQITNEQRAQRPAIQVSPVGDGATVETAQMLQGIIRHVEVASDAEVVYDTGTDQMVVSGFSYWRVVPEYLPGQTFQQCLKIKPFRNQFMVYWDPDSQEVDYTDADFCFIIADQKRDKFKRENPDSEAATLEDFSSVGDNAKAWISKEHVRIAEYFYVESKNEKIYQFQDGTISTVDLKDQEVVNERTLTTRSVKWAKITALDILQERDVPCKYITVIPIYGDDIEINGRRYLSGMVRNAKDPQRQLNYMKSAATEAIALAPKAPFVAAVGQIEGREKEWEQANKKSYSVLQYVPMAVGGQAVPPPQRQSAEPPIQAMTVMTQQADRDFESATGVPDAAVGERRADESGRSVGLRIKQGNIATLHYSDYVARAMRQTGRILIDMIPKVLDTPQIQRILKPDGSAEHIVTHNGPDQVEEARGLLDDQKKITKLLDLSVGTYDVTVSVGPSFQTKRQEEVAGILELIKAAPQILAVVGDLLVGNLDWNNAGEIAKRLKRMLPAQLQDQDGQDPAQQMQLLQQQHQAMAQELQQLTQALQQAQQVIATKKVEIDGRMAIAQLQEETKRMVAEITTKSQEVLTRAKIDAGLFTDIHTAAHETALAAGDQSHEKAMQGADQAHEADLAAQAAAQPAPGPGEAGANG